MLTKEVPFSETRCLGIPKSQMMLSWMKFATAVPLARFRVIASTHLVYPVVARIQVWPIDDRLIGAIRSKSHCRREYRPKTIVFLANLLGKIGFRKFGVAINHQASMMQLITRVSIPSLKIHFYLKINLGQLKFGSELPHVFSHDFVCFGGIHASQQHAIIRLLYKTSSLKKKRHVNFLNVLLSASLTDSEYLSLFWNALIS